MTKPYNRCIMAKTRCFSLISVCNNNLKQHTTISFIINVNTTQAIKKIKYWFIMNGYIEPYLKYTIATYFLKCLFRAYSCPTHYLPVVWGKLVKSNNNYFSDCIK